MNVRAGLHHPDPFINSPSSIRLLVPDALQGLSVKRGPAVCSLTRARVPIAGVRVSDEREVSR